MRFLIKYPKRFAIAIGAVVFNLINIVRAIMTGEVTEEMLVAFFLALFTLLGLYYNMPTSPEGESGTQLMLDMKENANIEWEWIEEPEDSEVSNDDE